MSLVQLESFVVVAQEAHVGRAAQRLHITRPPLTRRIHALEEELGVQLFERTPRGMQLLPEGELLLGHAHRVLAEVEGVRLAARKLVDARARGRSDRRETYERSSVDGRISHDA